MSDFKWYVYDPEDGLEAFASQEHAINCARSKIDLYMDYDAGEWIEGVERIAVFRKMCGVVDTSKDSEFVSWEIEPPKPSELEAENIRLRRIVDATREYWKHVTVRNHAQATVAWRRLAMMVAEWEGEENGNAETD